MLDKSDPSASASSEPARSKISPLVLLFQHTTIPVFFARRYQAYWRRRARRTRLSLSTMVRRMIRKAFWRSSRLYTSFGRITAVSRRHETPAFASVARATSYFLTRTIDWNPQQSKQALLVLPFAPTAHLCTVAIAGFQKLASRLGQISLFQWMATRI